MRFFYYYIIIINLAGFITMYIDKNRAIKKEYRIPEHTIFEIALCLGSLGVLLGMYTFRHKTKHMKFVLGIPAIMLLQIYILNYFNILT